MKTYHPLDVYFQPIGAPNYTVTLTTPRGRNATGVISLPTAQPEFVRIQALMRRGNVNFEDLRKLGVLLFESLFQDNLRYIFTEARQNLGTQDALCLRLHMDIDSAAELATIPWEYLFAPDDRVPLAIRDIPIVRCISRSDQLAPPLETPLRILLSTASAIMPRLDSERELQIIQQTLLRLGTRVQVTIDTSLSISKLEQYLLNDYQIWHFVGHGRRAHTGESCLLLQDETGDPEELGALPLLSLLSASNVKLVVLDACDSGSIAPQAIWNIAPSLVREAVPTVVAMQLPIDEEAARAFATGFYNGLVEGQQIETSVNTGRRAMVVRTRSLRPEWGIPVVYTRSTWQAQASPTDRVLSLFDILNRLLKDPQNRAAMQGLLGLQSTLRRVRIQIKELLQYKSAHDMLHTMHDQYELLIQDQKRLTSEPRTWLDLMRNEPALYTNTEHLIRHVSTTAVLGSCVRRVSTLSRARIDLRQAIQQHDQHLLNNALASFRIVLETVPDRINIMLVELARMLPLSQLADELNQFISHSAAFKQGTPHQRTFILFQQGLEELSQISANLSSLIECHNSFQDLDLELRPVELDLNRDIEIFSQQFAIAWREHLHSISLNIIDIKLSWADALHAHVKSLDDLLITGGDSYPIVASFIHYRALINQFFSRTDEDILNICRRLDEIGHQIDLVLELLT